MHFVETSDFTGRLSFDVPLLVYVPCDLRNRQAATFVTRLYLLWPRYSGSLIQAPPLTADASYWTNLSKLRRSSGGSMPMLRKPRAEGTRHRLGINLIR